jgi:hypothetical protein
MLYTTLNLCRENEACVTGYEKLIKSLPKDHGKDEPISLLHVLESNGLDDAIWALRATTKPCREFITEFAVLCAEQVLDIYEKRHPDDDTVKKCLEGIRQFQKGEISEEGLRVLRKAARAAAYAAHADAAAAAAYAADAAAYAAHADAAYAADAYAADAAAYAAYAGRVKMEEWEKNKLVEMLNTTGEAVR